MIRLVGVVTGMLVLALPAAAQSDFELVPKTDGATACWQRTYGPDHLAAHPEQMVTAMTFTAGFFPNEDATPEDPGLTLFGMDVTLRDGAKGRTSGGCWQGERGLMCGVECDGGGVMVSGARDGGLLIDLEATGYIRMEGECGSDGEAESFALEPGLDDKQFVLHVAEAKACKGLLPTW